jgi:hypothetical protein
MGQRAEAQAKHLLCECKALSSKSSTAKKKNTGKKKHESETPVVQFRLQRD